ncbi:MAG TPA: sensor histidine kinase [Gaiellaceae bacterium]|nr:sensor histidine kinase [Gaiellaceae bacterium]
MGIDAWLERRDTVDDLEPNVRFRRARMRVGVALGLLFLAGPVSDLAHAGIGSARRAGLAVGLAAFVVLYAVLLPPGPWLARLGSQAHRVGLAALALIAGALLVAGAPHSFAALFVYVAAASGLLLRPRNAVWVTLLTGAGVGVVGLSTGESRSAVAAAVLTIASIGALMAAFGRQVRANRELREAREELARLAVADERLRIARDLHDLLGHTLSVIALKSELAEKLVARDPERAAAELAEVQQVTRQALGEVREAVHAYRQLALDEALGGARAALAAAGIECRVDEAELEVPDDVEAVLAWAVREGTTNVVRHSGAHTCAIRIEAVDGAVAVEVEDDGRGPKPGRAGSGLAGLAERAARVRGSLEAGARPEGGFRLRLTVPVAA